MAIFENIIDDDFSEIIKDKYTKNTMTMSKVILTWVLCGEFTEQ